MLKDNDSKTVVESENRQKDTFREQYTTRIQPKHVWGFIFVITTIGLAAAALIINGVVLIALVLSLISAVAIIVNPIYGLILFVVLNFIRPSDFIPGLEAIPLAKMIGGGTLLALILKHIRTKDILFKYRQTYLLFIFTIILFLSVPLSLWPTDSYKDALDFTKIILFYLIFINTVRSLSRLRMISLVALGSIMVLAYSVIKSYLAGDFRAAATIGSGLYGDANDVALTLVTALPFAVFLKGSKLKDAFKNLLYWGIIAVMVTAVITTQSRGGMLGLIAVLFVIFTKGKNKFKGILVLTVIGMLIFAFMPSDIGERYSTISTYDEDASAMNRIYAWQAGIKMMIAHPFTGVGLGQFETGFSIYKPAAYHAARWMSPHNTWIQIAGETGVFGVIIWSWLFIYCFLELKRLKPEGLPEDKKRISNARDIILASLIGFGVCAFFLTQALNYMFYFLVAASVCLKNINLSSAAKADTLYSRPTVKNTIAE
ncbi:MAG: hypothetical protein GY855_13605 [candidate division Zixibacteria bacterium]|nr:hypothetical protein [candidate division Zixibacteria bacterium]